MERAGRRHRGFRVLEARSRSAIVTSSQRATVVDKKWTKERRKVAKG